MALRHRVQPLGRTQPPLRSRHLQRVRRVAPVIGRCRRAVAGGGAPYDLGEALPFSAGFRFPLKGAAGAFSNALSGGVECGRRSQFARGSRWSPNLFLPPHKAASNRCHSVAPRKAIAGDGPEREAVRRGGARRRKALSPRPIIRVAVDFSYAVCGNGTPRNPVGVRRLANTCKTGQAYGLLYWHILAYQQFQAHPASSRKRHVKSAGIRISTTALAIVMAAGLATVPGQAQRIVDRQSGPRDWSHGRVVATRFGPDQDRLLKTNWRTVMKHAQIERTRAGRSPDGSPTKPDGRLDTERAGHQARLGICSEMAGRLARQAVLIWLEPQDRRLRIGRGSPAKLASTSPRATARRCLLHRRQAGTASAVSVIGLTTSTRLLEQLHGRPPTVSSGSVAQVRRRRRYQSRRTVTRDQSRASGRHSPCTINVDQIRSPGTGYDPGLVDAHIVYVVIGTPTGEQPSDLFPSTVVNNLSSPISITARTVIFRHSTENSTSEQRGPASASRDTTNFTASR